MIRTKLLDQQMEIVEFGADKPYVGIFSDYGTGKTLASLALVQVRKFRKVLVVATRLAIESTWVDEIRKHTDFRFCILQGTAKQKINLLTYAMGMMDQPARFGSPNVKVKPMIFLLNYGGVRSIYMELIQAGFDIIIADESTKIKTHNAKRTMALFEVGDRVQNRAILTGFPITEALYEIYSQIKFLDKGETFGHSYWAFLNKYFVRMGPKLIAKRNAVKQILNLIKPFCIRITNDHLKLPPKRYKPIAIEPTDQQRVLLKKLNETYQLEFGDIKFDTQYIFSILSKSLEICDGYIEHKEYEKKQDPKTGNWKNTNKLISRKLEIVETNKDEVLLETLDEIGVCQERKVVIWAIHLFSVEKLRRILTKYGFKVLTLTGATKNINGVVSAFQNSKDYNIILCTQKMAAESVTLTASKYAIYYSNLWSNDSRSNSEARIRRIGSEKHDSIMYIDLIIKGSVEKVVYECLTRKKNLIKELKTAFLEMRKVA